jgi:chemotaxis protein CheC
MPTLTAGQTDALTELVNISLGLTAAKLSEISGCRILLDIPIIGIHPLPELVAELKAFVNGPTASIHQVFSGPISGDAILLLDRESSINLSTLLGEGQRGAQLFECSSSEILTEVGNMLLSACLGMFGNLLQVHIKFSVPQLHLNSLEDFLRSITIAGDELRYAVVITAKFNIREQGVDGRVVIVLGVSSLERLIQAVERWESGQDTA